MVSVPGPTRPSHIRVRQSPPDELGGNSSGLEHLFSRRSVPGMLHPWARAGSHRFPGDPSQAFALLQDPGRAGKISSLAVVPTPPPAKPNRRPQRVHNLEANTGLQLPLSTLRERRRRLPRKIRFRLAGCASTGRESNPLDRFERFQVTPILLSRTSPVARFVYAKRPFAGPAAVLAYLSRYTHRVAISNSRLIDMTGEQVRFRWRDYRHPNKSKVMTLAADEFIRRFLLHTLPHGFHRIRHYGFLGNRHRDEKLALCRRLLAIGAAAPPDNADESGLPQDRSFDICPCCGGRMEMIGPLPRSRPADPPAWHDSS